MSNFIKGIFSLIFKTFIIGPILSTSNYSNKSNDVSTSLTSYGFIIAIAVGFIDSVLYGLGLYLSMQTINNQQISDGKYFQSISIQEKQFLQPISESIELLNRTQKDLNDLIKDIIRDNTTDQILIQNTLNKLSTLEFIQKDSVMTLKKNIHKGFQSFHNDFKYSILSNFYIFDKMYLYICATSFLIYSHQILLWFFQYLTLQNPKKYHSYAFILSILILNQSLGLICFLQITNTFYFLSLLSIYTCIFFIRSFMSLYHYAFCDY